MFGTKLGVRGGMFRQENLDFQNPRNANLGHSGKIFAAL